MSAFEIFTILQTVVMTLVTVLVWGLRQTAKRARGDAGADQRLLAIEAEVVRLRTWKHQMINWQQSLLLQLDERYYTRREVTAQRDAQERRRQEGE